MHEPPDWVLLENGVFIDLGFRRKLTRPQAAILKCLLEQTCWGYDIHKRTDIRPATIYNNLNRFEEMGVLEKSKVLPTPDSLRPRIAYTLTPMGRLLAERMVVDFEVEIDMAMESGEDI